VTRHLRVARPRAPRLPPRADLLLWAGFLLVLAVKLAFLGEHGTRDMDTAIGWGRDLLDRGLAQGYTGSNFPVAFQTYEGLVWLARELHVDEFDAMKALTLACDLLSFAALRAYLRRAGHDPRWAFLYWLSPFFLEMWLVGYDHFEMALLVLGVLLLAQRVRGAGWLLAGVPLALAFLQRPQAQALVGAVGLFGALSALDGAWARRSLRGLLNDRSVPAALLLVPSALLWLAYARYFATERGDGGYLLRTYTHLSDFSPALSANMLNVWQAVAELYRDHGEFYSQVWGPHVYHQIAAALGAAALVAGVALIVRARRDRPLDATTLLLLFALGAILLPNLYTRAHDVHFFLGGLLATLLVPLLPPGRRRWFVGLLVASLTLQAVNTLGLYGFGLTPRSDWAPVDAVRDTWTFGVRTAAALVNTALFVALLVALRPLVSAGDGARGAPRPPAGTRAPRATPA
jgi:hypothetical protein